MWTPVCLGISPPLPCYCLCHSRRFWFLLGYFPSDCYRSVAVGQLIGTAAVNDSLWIWCCVWSFDLYPGVYRLEYSHREYWLSKRPAIRICRVAAVRQREGFQPRREASQSGGRSGIRRDATSVTKFVPSVPKSTWKNDWSPGNAGHLFAHWSSWCRQYFSYRHATRPSLFKVRSFCPVV